MSTRQFIFVLVIVAMIATGVGLVIGARPTPNEAFVTTPPPTTQPPTTQPSATQAASSQAASSPTAAKKPAPSAQDVSAGAPGTKSVALAQPKAADAAPHTSETNKAPKTDDTLGAKTKKDAPASARSIADTSVDAKANDASKRAPAIQPTPTAPVAPTASDSDFVFVTKSSLVNARIVANEAAAATTLRSLSTAEAIIQSSGYVDTDNDGFGEYAYFGELSAGVPCRAAAGVKREKVQPPVLAATFATVSGAGNVTRSGYLYRIYLPGKSSGGKTPGVPEAAGGGCDAKGAQPDHDNCEVLWCCYAWPIEAASSGVRAFYMNQEGDMLVLDNADGAYSGEQHAPAFDAASTKPGDMAAEPVPGGKFSDGRAWKTYAGPEPEIPALVEIGPATEADIEKFNKPDSKEDKVVVPAKLVHRNGAAKKPMPEKMSVSEKSTAAPLSVTPMNSTAAENPMAMQKSTSAEKTTMAEKAPTPKASASDDSTAPAKPNAVLKTAPAGTSAQPANDNKVLANLRAISMAQSKAQSVAAIDTDKDGQGEYGFFGELAGTSPCRAPAGGKRALMKPGMLDASWGKVTESSNVVMDGYVYRMYLPAATKGMTPAICEAPGGGCVMSGARPDHDNAENLWSVYAWPLEAGKTGQRAYFTNQTGEILASPNTDGLYTGEQRAPAFDAALVASKAGDMYGATAKGGIAVDGRVWGVLH